MRTSSAFSWRRLSGGDVVLTLFAAFLTAVSFSVKDPQPYLFPRLLAGSMLLLCLAQLINSCRQSGAESAHSGILTALRKNGRMIVLIIATVAVSETAGFYASAALAFFTIVLISGGVYNKRALLIAAAATAGVLCTLYLLFSVLLKVQIPHGWLF